MAKSKEELVRILKSNINSFNNYRNETNNERLDLSGADLTGTNLCRANLENVILKDAELNFAYLHSAQLTNSDLSDLIVGRADMTEANLTNSILNGADLTNTILYGANLSNVKAHHMVLEGAKVREVNFSNADLTGANLANLDLNGVNFEKCKLNGVDFASSNLSNALNLNTCTYDETTMWPDSSNLPEKFDPSGTAGDSADFQDFEEESGLNAGFGPGISSGGQDYEFLDFPSKQAEEKDDGVPIGASTTELTSPFEREEEEPSEDLDELPDFEQFTMDQFEDTPPPQSEPGLAMTEPGLLEEPGELEDLQEDDPFSSSLSSTFDSMSTQKTSEPQIGGITQQDFPVGLGSSLSPDPTLMAGQEHQKKDDFGSHELPSQVPGHTPKPPPKQPPPAAQPAQPPAPAAAVSPDQMQSLMGMLGHISQKLDSIETEQKMQRGTINELKKAFADKHSSEMIAHKVEDLSAATRSIFSRIESKIDIIAQTDPLDQMDSLLGELADSMRNEQENIEAKVMELSTNLESVVSLLEVGPSSSDVDFTELTNNTHQMLSNLEANIREDQDRADKKIEDLATIIEGLSVILEGIPTDTTNRIEEQNKELKEKIEAISAQLNSEIFSVSDTVNNINNTVGTLIELNQDESAETQIYEAFYDFEFRLQLELEKNQSRLAHLEDLSEKTNSTLKEINEKSKQLDNITTLENIPKLLETFRNQLFTEIQQTEQRTNRIREVVDDMVIQLESVFNMQLENLHRSIGSKISNINDKIESMFEQDRTGIPPEINQKIENLLEIDTTALNNINSLNDNLENIQTNVNSSNTQLTDLHNRISNLDKEFNKIEETIEASRKESKIDDELRSIFEHLILQVGESSSESKETNEKVAKKLEDLEMDLQMTLKDMDRRINKINSMIRNVYKALDSVTDLITESSRGSAKPGDKTRKSLTAKSKLKNLEEEDNEGNDS